jgi:hypothetical protein
MRELSFSKECSLERLSDVVSPLMLAREVAKDVPDYQSVQEQTKTYSVRSFQGAECNSFKILDGLDCLLAELVRHLDTPREVSSAGFRLLNLGPGPFCVLASPAFASATRCKEAVYSLRFDDRCYFLPPSLRQGLLRAVPSGQHLGSTAVGISTKNPCCE